MISFARQDLILRLIEKKLYLFTDERSEGENKCTSFRSVVFQLNMAGIRVHVLSRGFRKNGAIVSEHFSVACI